MPNTENYTAVIFILIVLLVIFIVLFRNSRKKLKNTLAQLKEANAIAGAVTDAEEYTKQKESEANNLLSNAQKEAAELQAKVDALKIQRTELKSEVLLLELDVLANSVRIDAYEHMRSDEIKNELALLRSRQDELVKSGKAISITQENRQKRVIQTQTKQLLRCFNAECANILDAVTVKNADTSRAKIGRSFDTLNRMFSSDGVQITQEYLSSKFEELSLIYAYMVKEEEEKEQRKAIREQMIEEEKVRKEIEREKMKIDKEQAQFTNEVNKLMAYMQKAKDDVERTLYLDKIKELEEKLKALEADKENVLQREQNTRAGFVYIISNIGSFGEQVFKIGMTRRLEPMDRISELSSASVPFPFDVHALIFSDDAPGLESILHQHFDKNRVNKVNPRKEFFRINLDEIKQVVLENHNATVQFVDVPDALEYRETLKLAE